MKVSYSVMINIQPLPLSLLLVSQDAIDVQVEHKTKRSGLVLFFFPIKFICILSFDRPAEKHIYQGVTTVCKLILLTVLATVILHHWKD